MTIKSFLIWLLLPLSLFAQKDQEVYVDNHYLEDQFYLGLQYNALLNTKNGIENTGVPFSAQVGFIKDIPLNKKRNKSLGLGVGYSYDVLKPNISINTTNGKHLFNTNNANSYSYTTHHIEFPLEFRWRTSTPLNKSFWRVYTGISFMHQLSNRATIGSAAYKNIPELTKNNFTTYTSIGFGTWNFHIKYHVKPFFKNNVETTSGNKLNFHQLKIGVMFYLL